MIQTQTPSKTPETMGEAMPNPNNPWREVPQSPEVNAHEAVQGELAASGLAMQVRASALARVQENRAVANEARIRSAVPDMRPSVLRAKIADKTKLKTR